MSSYFKKLLLRRDNLSKFDDANPILSSGEPAFALDKNVLKIGDGEHRWQDLESFVSTREIKKASVSINVPSIEINDSATITATVSGINSNNDYAVFASPDSDLPSGVIISHSYVDSDNTIAIKFHNVSLSYIDGGSQSPLPSSNPYSGSINIFAYMTKEAVVTVTTTTTQPPEKDSFYSFGYNNFGQLGLGDRVDRSTPTFAGSAISGNDQNLWLDFSVGYYHSLGISSSGDLFSWGYNYYGQLGNGEDGAGKFVTYPTLVNSGSNWTKVAAGAYHSVALSGGKIFACGSNAHGSLGVGDTLHRKQLTGLETDYIFEDLDTNGSGVIVSNQLLLNYQGGDPYVSNKRYKLAVGTSGIINVETGYYIALLNQGNENLIAYSGVPGDPLTTSLDLEVTGTDNDGTYTFWNGAVRLEALGNFGTVDIYVYEQATSTFGYYGGEDLIHSQDDTGWTEISAGHYHTLGIKDGYLYSWGHNTFGQLGLNDYVDRLEPTLVNQNNDWVKVAAGNYHSLAIRNNGGTYELWTFGKNDHGQLGQNSTSANNNQATKILSSFNEISLYNTESLASSSNISVDNQKYIFNYSEGKSYDADDRYVLGVGTYVISGVPSEHPIAFLNAGKTSFFTYTGDSLVASKVVDGYAYDFYYGDVTITVAGNFDSISAYCYYHGYMGGEDIFLYDNNTGEPIECQAGIDFSIVRTNLDEVWTFGKNDVGQLGLADYTRRIKPYKIKEYDWQNIEAGASHVLLLDNAKRLWSFGDNTNGQLGLSDTFGRNEPTPVTTLERFDAIYAGGNHSLVSIFSTSPSTPVITNVLDSNERNDIKNKDLYISWDDPLKTEYGVIDYIIESGSSIDGPWSVYSDGVSNNTYVHVSGLTVGSGYFFRVKSESAIAFSEYSNVASGISAYLVDDLFCATTLLLHFDDNNLASSGNVTTVQTDTGTNHIVESGKFGGAFYTDSVTNRQLQYYNGTSELDMPNDFCIEFYFKNNSLPSDTTLRSLIYSNSFADSYITDNGFGIFASGNKIIFAEQVSGTISNVFEYTPTSHSNWNNFAWTREGTVNKIYYNGVLVNTNDVGFVSDYTQSTINIGGQHTNNNNSIYNGYMHNGYIDEVRITNDVRYTENFSNDVNKRPFGDVPPGGPGGCFSDFGLPPLEFDSAYSFNVDRFLASGPDYPIASGQVDNFDKYATSGNGLPSNEMKVDIGQNFFFDGGVRSFPEEDNRVWIKCLVDGFVDITFTQPNNTPYYDAYIFKTKELPYQHNQYQDLLYSGGSNSYSSKELRHDQIAFPKAHIDSNNFYSFSPYDNVAHYPFTSTLNGADPIGTVRYENVPVKRGEYIVCCLAHTGDDFPDEATNCVASGEFKIVSREVKSLLDLDFEKHLEDSSSFGHKVFVKDTYTPYYDTDSVTNTYSLSIPNGSTIDTTALASTGVYRNTLSVDFPTNYLNNFNNFTIETWFKPTIEAGDGIKYHRLFALERSASTLYNIDGEKCDFLNLTLKSSGNEIQQASLGFASFYKDSDASTSGLLYGLKDGDDVVNIYSISGASTNIINVNDWNHVALVKYYDMMLLFFNGTPTVRRLIGNINLPRDSEGVTVDNQNLEIPPRYNLDSSIQYSDRITGAPFTIGPLKGKLDKFEISKYPKYLSRFNKDLLPTRNNEYFRFDGLKYRKLNTFFPIDNISGIFNSSPITEDFTVEEIQTSGKLTSFTRKLSVTQDLYFRVFSDKDVARIKISRVNSKGENVGDGYNSLSSINNSYRLYYEGITASDYASSPPGVDDAYRCYNISSEDPARIYVSDYNPIINGGLNASYITNLHLLNTSGVNYYQDFSVKLNTIDDDTYVKLEIVHDSDDATFDKPSEPHTIIANSGYGSIIPSWNAPLDFNGQKIIDYIVNYKLLDDTEYSKYHVNYNASISGVYSATIDNLLEGSGYDVRISARNILGESNLSSGISIYVRPYEAPSSPQNLAIYSTSGAALMTWDEPLSNGGKTITSYNISYTPSGSAEALKDISVPSVEQRYILDGLTNDLLHDIKIRAVNEIGSGTFSDTLTRRIQNKTIQTVGDNQYGQLGDGTTTDNDEFVSVGSSGDWIEIDISERNGCAINSSGELYTWGYNAVGELGIGNQTASYVPVKVLDPVGESNIKWKKCAAGLNATVAISESGIVYACGSSSFLSNGSVGYSTVMVKVGDEDFQSIKFVDVKAGRSAISLSEDGDIYAWPPVFPDGEYPEKINLGQNKYKYISEVTPTGYTTYVPCAAITEQGSGYIIRRYSYGTYHDIVTSGNNNSTPIPLTKISFDPSTITAITLSENGKVYVAGYNVLGDGITGSYGNWNTISNYLYLVEASGLPQTSYPIVDVKSTLRSLHYLDRNGSLFGIGPNYDGQLGIGTTNIAQTYWLESSGNLYYDKIGSSPKNVIALGSTNVPAVYATTTTTTTTPPPATMTQTQTGGYTWLGGGSSGDKFRLDPSDGTDRIRGQAHSPYHSGWDSSNAPKWTITTAGTLNISRTGWSSGDDDSDHQIYKNETLALTLSFGTTGTSTLAVSVDDIIEWRGGQAGSYQSDTYIINPELWIT